MALDDAVARVLSGEITNAMAVAGILAAAIAQRDGFANCAACRGQLGGAACARGLTSESRSGSGTMSCSDHCCCLPTRKRWWPRACVSRWTVPPI